MNFTRRKFLQQLTAVAAAGVVPWSLGHAAVNTRDAKALSFVDLNGFGPQMSGPSVTERFIPLHSPLLMTESHSSEESRQIRRILQQEFAAAGESWSDDAPLVWTYQHFGVPDHTADAFKLLEYCKQVQHYLADNLDTLTPFEVHWQLLNKTPQEHAGVQALVGKYTYYVARVGVMDEDGAMREPSLVNARPVERAVNHIVSSANHQQPDNSLIYIIRGTTSLVSPFSELLHLTTHTSSMRYTQELAQTQSQGQARNTGRILGETVTESAAILLSLHYLHDHGGKALTPYVLQHANSLARQLPLFRRSVAYMQKYGITRALRFYNESPAAYFAAIERMA